MCNVLDHIIIQGSGMFPQTVQLPPQKTDTTSPIDILVINFCVFLASRSMQEGIHIPPPRSPRLMATQSPPKDFLIFISPSFELEL